MKSFYQIMNEWYFFLTKYKVKNNYLRMLMLYERNKNKHVLLKV